MIKIIGTHGCSKCEMSKAICKQKDIDFEYQDFNTLSTTEQDKLIKLAKENNLMSFPIILNNENITTLEEILH